MPITASQLALIAAFGALGAVCRVWIGTLLNPPDLARIPALPWGTVAVNLVGCLLLGLLAGISASSPYLPATLRAPLMAGFLGSLTTFSTFSLEVVRLAQHGAWSLVAAQLFLQLGGGILFATLGLVLGQRLT